MAMREVTMSLLFNLIIHSHTSHVVKGLQPLAVSRGYTSGYPQLIIVSMWMGLPIGQTIWCFLPKNVGIRAKAHPSSLANRLTSVSNSQAAAQMRRSLLEFRRLGQVANKRVGLC